MKARKGESVCDPKCLKKKEKKGSGMHFLLALAGWYGIMDIIQFNLRIRMMDGR